MISHLELGSSVGESMLDFLLPSMIPSSPLLMFAFETYSCFIFSHVASVSFLKLHRTEYLIQTSGLVVPMKKSYWISSNEK